MVVVRPTKSISTMGGELIKGIKIKQSQQVHHNSRHVPNLSNMSPDSRHFHLLGRRSNIPLNRKTNQNKPLQTKTIPQEIKQHYLPNTIIKGKINTWPTTMLGDSRSVVTIINTELLEQVNNEFQLSSTETKLLGPNNANVEVIGETFV